MIEPIVMYLQFHLKLELKTWFMGSQLNPEFTLSTRFCSYLYHDDVTKSISSPALRSFLLWPLNSRGHIVLEADRRLPFHPLGISVMFPMSPVHVVCVERRGWSVSDLLIEHTQAHERAHSGTVQLNGNITCSRACNKYLHLSPTYTFCTFWLKRLFEDSLLVAGLVITFSSWPCCC